MCKSLLVFIIAGDIVLPVLDGVGQVLLGGPVIGVVMRVEVVLSLDLSVGAVIVLVLQLPRDRPGAPGLNIGNGCIDAVMGRIRFGGGGHQHHGIRQRQTSLRQADSVGNIDRSLYDGDNLRPGQATSSHAQTIKRRQALGRSPASSRRPR